MKKSITAQQKSELTNILLKQKDDYKKIANKFSSKEDLENSIFGDDDLVEMFFNDNFLDEDYIGEFRDIQHDIVYSIFK